MRFRLGGKPPERRYFEKSRRGVVCLAAVLGLVTSLPASTFAAGDEAGWGLPTDTATGQYLYTNRLINSHDPYLLLHAHNPVDWYPWSPEALTKAKEENKPIFVSIGYSTCYWCHVAERTIYSNPEIAKLMNQWFVKLSATHDAWAEHRTDKVLPVAEQVFRAMQRVQKEMTAGSEAPMTPSDWLRAAGIAFQRKFDAKNGGLGDSEGRTKFPQVPSLELLLAGYRLNDNAISPDVLTATLDAMAFGGIHDQLAGVPPLLDGTDLVDPAFREDALRQCAASAALCGIV